MNKKYLSLLAKEFSAIDTAIISSNDEDGVSHWLERNYRQHRTKTA